MKVLGASLVGIALVVSYANGKKTGISFVVSSNRKLITNFHVI